MGIYERKMYIQRKSFLNPRTPIFLSPFANDWDYYSGIILVASTTGLKLMILIEIYYYLCNVETCTNFVPALARNSSWQCVPKKRKRESSLRIVRIMFTHKLRTWHAMRDRKWYTLARNGTLSHDRFTPRQVLLVHCLRIVYDMVRMTLIVPAWACTATTSSRMCEALVALFSPALSRLIHSLICYGPNMMLNTREEALIAQKRTCLYYLSAAALLLLEDQEKRKKEQAKKEITPTRKRKARTVWVTEWLTR